VKIIIRQGKTSRWLEWPFNLVGSRADLRQLAEMILEQTRDENFSYGTLYIQPRYIFGEPNTAPSPWEPELSNN